jgi:hypothetical protein
VPRAAPRLTGPPFFDFTPASLANFTHHFHRRQAPPPTSSMPPSDTPKILLPPNQPPPCTLESRPARTPTPKRQRAGYFFAYFPTPRQRIAVVHVENTEGKRHALPVTAPALGQPARRRGGTWNGWCRSPVTYFAWHALQGRAERATPVRHAGSRGEARSAYTPIQSPGPATLKSPGLGLFWPFPSRFSNTTSLAPATDLLLSPNGHRKRLQDQGRPRFT